MQVQYLDISKPIKTSSERFINLSFDCEGSTKAAESYTIDKTMAEELYEVLKNILYPTVENPTVGSECEAMVLQYLQNNFGKIQAIKWIREQTGWGLKEAKDYVDRIQRKHGIKCPSSFSY
jgi:hypothetical protein